MSDPYVGEVRIVGFNFAPNGWATCAGQTVSISQNTTLFALIGTTYGGNGQTTYNLPDLQGRLAIGQGQGAGLSNYVQGQLSGSESRAILISNLPAHNHAIAGSIGVATTVGTYSKLGGIGNPTGHILAKSQATSTPPSLVETYSDQEADGALGGVSSVATPSLSTALTGNNIPFPIAQPYLVINYVISLFGVFPSRN
jgi:microcystin-dependent protein